jgi:protein-tyrosine-phosphatase
MARPVKVLFVCLHGAAKSVIAREHFSRLARAEGVQVVCSSAGIEPDDRVPPHVVRGLAEDGIEIADSAPRPLSGSEIADADIVVSFGCELEPAPASGSVVRWDDIPAVSDGYAPARDAIVGRLRTLLGATLSLWPRATDD